MYTNNNTILLNKLILHTH